LRTAALPAALLVAALAFALSFAPRRALWIGLPILAVACLAASLVRTPLAWQDALFLACWASVIATAALVHLPKGVGVGLGIGAAANAGLWSGLLIGTAGEPSDLVKIIPVALLCIPGAWLAAHPARIALKVAASWLIAVSVLAAAIPFTTPTPGYVQDHME
jgi:hypothetical protein